MGIVYEIKSAGIYIRQNHEIKLIKNQNVLSVSFIKLAGKRILKTPS